MPRKKIALLRGVVDRQNERISVESFSWMGGYKFSLTRRTRKESVNLILDEDLHAFLVEKIRKTCRPSGNEVTPTISFTEEGYRTNTLSIEGFQFLIQEAADNPENITVLMSGAEGDIPSLVSAEQQHFSASDRHAKERERVDNSLKALLRAVASSAKADGDAALTANNLNVIRQIAVLTERLLSRTTSHVS